MKKFLLYAAMVLLGVIILAILITMMALNHFFQFNPNMGDAEKTSYTLFVSIPGLLICCLLFAVIWKLVGVLAIHDVEQEKAKEKRAPRG